MGEIPHWYGVLRAAKYLGVAPWDLIEREELWMNLALAAEDAEARVQQKNAEQAQRRAKRKRG